MFAGIGGLELGLTRAGHTTRLLCENDPAALAVLRAQMPGVRVASDVRELKVLPPDVDLLAAGFPCQDLSPAGGTAGIWGAKSGLVAEVFRLLRRRPVPWVLLENVPFMLHLQRGRAMDYVVGELESLGYRWAYRVVDAMAFGLPQRRRRVFLLASLVGDPAAVLLAEDVRSDVTDVTAGARPVGFYWTEGNRGIGWAAGAVPTLKGGSGLGIPSPPAILLRSGDVVTPMIRDAERLQGFPAGWTEQAEKQVGSGRVRWRLVGNAVAVPVARWIGSRLRRPRRFDPRCIGAPLSAHRWPDAACQLGEGRFAVSVGDWPVCRVREDIEAFLGGRGNPLSRRATEGFVTRAERAVEIGALRVPSDFLRELRVHMDSPGASISARVIAPRR